MVDQSLCHGNAGIAHIAARMAADANPGTAAQLRSAATNMLNAVHPPDTDPQVTATALLATAGGTDLLEGATGVAIAVHAATLGTPHTGWDSCLLIG